MYFSHGRGIYDIRFAAIDHALEPIIQSDTGLLGAKQAAEAIKKHDAAIFDRAKRAHDKRNERRVKKGKATQSFEYKSKDGALLTILPPIVHNLPIKKPKTRKVFTFKGIQSSKGVTHDRETDRVYNYVYPDVPRTSGLVIPKSLIKTENRPKTQLKTARHKRVAEEKLENIEKKFRKLKRVKLQREEWEKIELKGECVKEWQPKKKRKPRLKTPPKKQAGKRPPKRQAKKRPLKKNAKKRTSKNQKKKGK